MHLSPGCLVYCVSAGLSGAHPPQGKGSRAQASLCRSQASRGCRRAGSKLSVSWEGGEQALPLERASLCLLVPCACLSPLSPDSVTVLEGSSVQVQDKTFSYLSPSSLIRDKPDILKIGGTLIFLPNSVHEDIHLRCLRWFWTTHKGGRTHRSLVS